MTSRVDSLITGLSNSFGPGVRVTAQSTFAMVDAEGWLWLREDDYIVVRATIQEANDDVGHLMIALRTVEAINLAGRMMMAPEDVIEAQHERGDLTGGYAAAFAEVANLMCCDAESAMRHHRGEGFSLRFDRFGAIRPGFDLDSILIDGDQAVFDFTIQIGEAEATPASVLLDLNLAKLWNEGECVAIEAPKALDGEEEIPQAPICAKLSAYVVSREALAIVRRSGRRLGIEIHTHNRTDIPNPDAHRGEIVLLEVPPGDVKRFDWAKRIKQMHSEIQVVLIIHEPSHAMVRLGFLTKADVVAAWPCPEKQLSTKLAPLLTRLLS